MSGYPAAAGISVLHGTEIGRLIQKGSYLTMHEGGQPDQKKNTINCLQRD